MIVRFMNEVLQVLAPGYKVALDPNGGHHIVLIHHDSNDSEMPALVGDIPALVGDIDNDMQALVDSSDSDEEDIQAPPGPAATAGGFANPGPDLQILATKNSCCQPEH